MKALNVVLFAVVAILMFAVTAMPLALAEENQTENVSVENQTEIISNQTEEIPVEDTEIEEEAAADDNATVSPGEIFRSQLRLWFTFNQEKKAELELKLARLRLIQARVAARNNNTEAMQKALEAHERLIDRVHLRMKALDKDFTVKDINASSIKLRGLLRAIEVHEIRIARLNALLEKANLTDEQRAKIEARISHVENVTAKLKALNEERKEKLVTRLMAVANITEEQAEEIVEAGRKIRADIRERIKEKLNRTD